MAGKMVREEESRKSQFASCLTPVTTDDEAALSPMRGSLAHTAVPIPHAPRRSGSKCLKEKAGK